MTQFKIECRSCGQSMTNFRFFICGGQTTFTFCHSFFFMCLVSNLGNCAKKIRNVNFFQKGGCQPQSLHFKKVYAQWKEASKWICLTQECVLVSSESNRRSFGTPNFSLNFFLKKLTFWGGGSTQIWKKISFWIFVVPFPYKN